MPFSLAVSTTFLSSLLEPVPDPTITPVLSLFISSKLSPASATASSVDKNAYAEVSLINLSIFLSITSRFGFTWPEI